MMVVRNHGLAWIKRVSAVRIAAVTALSLLIVAPLGAQTPVVIPTPGTPPGRHLPPAPVLAAMVAGVLLILLVIAFIYSIARRESAARRAQEAPRKRSSRRGTADNPAWGDTGKGRRARDPTDVRMIDDDLPPISVMTGATWADKDQAPAVPRQSSLIAASPSSEAELDSNVYKTGYNPFFRQNPSEDIQVEEVADLVQQAELMVTLANYPAAISMLTRHIRDTEAPSPKAWLMLFDLYARTEREDQYTNLAKGFRIQFNAEIPSWNAQKTEKPRYLEDYPRVMERVCGAWSTKDIRALLNSLLFDDRGGSRQGFMLEAYSDLIMLLDLVDLLGTIEREMAERLEIEKKLQSKPLV